MSSNPTPEERNSLAESLIAKLLNTKIWDDKESSPITKAFGSALFLKYMALVGHDDLYLTVAGALYPAQNHKAVDETAFFAPLLTLVQNKLILFKINLRLKIVHVYVYLLCV